jgi:hypothetical protein
MHRFSCTFALALAVSAHAVAAEPSAGELRQEIHAALRTETTSAGAEHADAVRRLTELYNIAGTHAQLSDNSRRQLTAMLRARLKRIEASLEKQLDKHPNGNLQQLDASSDSPNLQAIFAQAPGNLPALAAPAGGAAVNIPGQLPPGPAPVAAGVGGNGLDAQTVANANQLIELIHNTIAPKSWDVRGGPGTIRYFAPSQVLVIRQTDGVHDQVGAAIGRLRAAGQQP